MINLSAAPFSLGRDESRFGLSQSHARRFNLPFIMVNQTGAQDELIYDGTSIAIDKNGDLIIALEPFEPGMKTIDLNGNMPTKEFKPLEKITSIHKAVVLGVRDYVRKCEFSDVLVGLSGGIDSAVTCVLAVAALGKERVTGVTMPSVFSSEGSINDSEILAANLGISFKTIPIRDIHQHGRDRQPAFGKLVQIDEQVQHHVQADEHGHAQKIVLEKQLQDVSIERSEHGLKIR